MRSILFTFLAVVLLSSCQQDKTKPSPFIEESKMEDILYDVTLLYGMQNTNSFANDTVAVIKMSDIFKKYAIDSVSFAENSRYYISLKKGVYFDMQTRVLERLKKEEERLAEQSSKQEDVKLKAISRDTLTNKLSSKEELVEPIETSVVKKERKVEKVESTKTKDVKSLKIKKDLLKRFEPDKLEKVEVKEEE